MDLELARHRNTSRAQSHCHAHQYGPWIWPGGQRSQCRSGSSCPSLRESGIDLAFPLYFVIAIIGNHSDAPHYIGINISSDDADTKTISPLVSAQAKGNCSFFQYSSKEGYWQSRADAISSYHALAAEPQAVDVQQNEVEVVEQEPVMIMFRRRCFYLIVNVMQFDFGEHFVHQMIHTIECQRIIDH